jgi:hypothetical protein
MRVDLYTRPEAEGKLSYLAVPEGQKIPEEVINTDWSAAGHGVELADHARRWGAYGIEKPESQIAEKGYAITSVAEQQPAGSPR